MTLESVRIINAPADVVWAITLDVERWPESTPTITSVERLETGPMRVGSTARIKQPGMRPAVWTVSALEAPRLFVWGTKVMGVQLNGEHHIDSVPEGCRNTLRITASGRGSKLVLKLLGKKLLQTIETENDGFQRVAQAAVAPR